MRRYKRKPSIYLSIYSSLALSVAALMSGCGQPGAAAAGISAGVKGAETAAAKAAATVTATAAETAAATVTATMAETHRPSGVAAPLPPETGTEMPQETGAKMPQGTGTEMPQGTGAKMPQGTGTQMPQGTGAEMPPETSARPPTLPKTGAGLEDFIPEGWTLLDSAALDFNRDGRPDYVGVLDADGEDVPPSTPRILFAVASCGDHSFRLDFQDENLIRNRDEGGVFGDPYVPLSADGTTFTTSSFGGSAWKWEEAYTYAYRDGTWYLSSAHTTYGYGTIITEETEDNYETGVGIRKKRASNWEQLENIEIDSDEFDLVYQVRLDAPPDISQAGKRWWLSPYRLTECPVKTVAIADGIDLKRSQVQFPLESSIEYRDENLLLYTFTDKDRQKIYLACYREDSQSLTVIAQGTTEQSAFDSCFAYKDNVYYTMSELADVSVKSSDGAVTTSNRTVAQTLYRLAPDGSGRQEIFQYRLAQPGETAFDAPLPYLSLICECTGDELIVQVYLGGRPHPFYRMNPDGSNVQEIGFLPDGV